MRKIAANYIYPISSEPIKNGYVKIDDNGTVVEIGQLDRECEDTEFYNGILCPGFTNAHSHIELSHLKGLFKEATGMSGFINQINELRSAVEQPERIKLLEEQFNQLYQHGVSAMADISNCSESFAIKAKSPMKTRTFVELFGTLPQEAEDVINSGKELVEKAKEYGINAAITPHACYTMSPQLLARAAQEGLKSGFLSYHSQESPEEEDLLISGTGALAENYKGRNLPTPPVTGKPALLYFLERLLSFSHKPVQGRIILVHNVTTNQQSIDAALDTLAEPFWAICPLSNIFIHRQLPDLDLFRKNNLAICLGTDSLSSNKILSITEEIKCLHEHFPHIELTEILTWACLNGAKAIGYEKELGSFEIGKKPGIVLIDNIDWNTFKLTEKSTSRRLV